MEIKIIEDDIIRNIEQEFRKQYAYLKLQFYKNPHGEGEPSPVKERLNAALPIEEVTMFHTAGKINTSPGRTVAQVEHDFYHFLGLCVQILRQSGDLWIETTGTDQWTLQQQNDKGREHSLPPNQNEPEEFQPAGYRLGNFKTKDMTFRKPYRICNMAIPGKPEPTAGNENGVTATLKELKDRYELRIWIPGSRKRNYAVSITDGILYVYEDKVKDLSSKSDILGRFILPANVQQDKVEAYYRNYGLKIILPIASPGATTIRVPVLRETPLFN